MNRISKGQRVKFSARRENEVNATVEAVRRMKEGGSSPLDYSKAGVTLLVKNASGADVSRLGILGIDGVVFEPDDANDDRFKNQQVLSGVSPTEADHTGKFVICIDAIANGKIGRGLLMGVTAVLIAFPDEASDDYATADVYDSTPTGALKAINGGGAAQILWRPEAAHTGGGVHLCLVRVGVPASPFRIPVDGYCVVKDAFPDNHFTGYSARSEHPSSTLDSVVYPETGYIQHLVGKFERPFVCRPDSRIVVPMSDWIGGLVFFASVDAPSVSLGGFGPSWAHFLVRVRLKAICNDFDASNLTYNQYADLEKMIYGQGEFGIYEGGGWGSFPARTLGISPEQGDPENGFIVGRDYNTLFNGKQVFGFGVECFNWYATLGGSASGFKFSPNLQNMIAYAVP